MIRAALIALTALLAAGPASAQSGSPTADSTTSPATETFGSLSPGNQSIAKALFDAQTVASTPGETGTTPLTLDEIAAMKQAGKGWGEIFHEMKAQGLVQEKNLGQVVRAPRVGGNTAGPPISDAGEATTASGTAARGRADRGYRSTGPVITSGSGRTHDAGRSLGKHGDAGPRPSGAIEAGPRGHGHAAAAPRTHALSGNGKATFSGHGGPRGHGATPR